MREDIIDMICSIDVSKLEICRLFFTTMRFAARVMIEAFDANISEHFYAIAVAPNRPFSIPDCIAVEVASNDAA